MNQPKLLWSYWHSIARSCSSSSPIDSLTTPGVLPVTESFKYRCNYHQNTHGTKLYDSSGRLLKSVSQSSTGHRCPKTHLIATHIGQLTQLTNHYSSLKKKNEYRFDWQADSFWISLRVSVALRLTPLLQFADLPFIFSAIWDLLPIYLNK